MNAEDQSEPKRAYIAHRRESGETQPLDAHLRNVAKICAKNASKLTCCALSSLTLQDAGELLGLLHDLGKYSREFQNYLRSAVGLIDQDAEDYVDSAALKGRVDHSTAGAQWAWRELSAAGPAGQLTAQVLALCLASHHSGLIDCISPGAEDCFTRRMDKVEEKTHLAEALSHAAPAVRSRVQSLVGDGAVVSGFHELARRIARLEEGCERSHTVLQFKLGLLVRYLFSCLIDADRVDTADFEAPRAGMLRQHGRYAGWDDLIDRLETFLDEFATDGPVDKLRREVSEHCRNAAARDRGIFTLTVPTGGGKTLASLRFALHHSRRHRLDRVFYIIPFTSIIDQNADVVRRVLEPPALGIRPGSIVLEHHSNLTPEEQTWRGKILSENWDAPVVFTTSVQFLEALFGSGTRGARRMHQLANSVIVFDEAQTVPVRCVHLFNNAMNFLVEHCGSSVVLCTATQPLLNSVDSAKGTARLAPGAEIVPDVRSLFAALKRTEVVPGYRAPGWTDSEVAELAAREVEDAGSCLVVVNTRKAAYTVFNACPQQEDTQLYHLSTMMCPAHRRTVLGEIRKQLCRGERTLCVSTQLIEAGVDVDFGCVIRYLAGLDSVAQAAGRCNRNARRVVGRVHIVNPAEESIDRLTDIRVGRDVSLRVLAEYEQNTGVFHDDLIGPEAMRRYFDYYFFQRAKEMDYPVGPDDALRDDTLLNLLSENRLAVDEYKQRQQTAPPLILRQAFMTAARAFRAIDAPIRGVIVPYGEEGADLIARLCGAYKPDTQVDLLRRAQQFSVNLYAHVFDALQQSGAITEISDGAGIYYLDKTYYNEKFGLSEFPVNPMEALVV